MANKIKDIERRVDNLETKFEMFMQELRDFKTEMRQQNQMRAEEIRELRQRQDIMQERIDSKFDNIISQIHNLTIAAVVGFGAVAAAVGGLVFAAFK